MDGKNSDSYQVVWLVRRLFRALTQKSNESLEHWGISAADRAVMEFLYPDRQLSVPEIARQYQVSRQHIQVTVNRLLEKKLVTSRSNPRHKRSSLLALTASGRSLFETVLADDERALKALFAGIPTADVRTSRSTLERVLAALETP